METKSLPTETAGCHQKWQGKIEGLGLEAIFVNLSAQSVVSNVELPCSAIGALNDPILFNECLVNQCFLVISQTHRR